MCDNPEKMEKKATGTDGTHVQPEDYRERVRQGGRDAGARLAKRIQQHLLETCSECRKLWDQLGRYLQPSYLQHISPGDLPLHDPQPSCDDVSGSTRAINDLAEQARQRRYHHRRASKQLSELRMCSADRRIAKIRNARKRFNSRHLAELLVEESRSQVRNDPREAESYAALVPLVLEWTQGEAVCHWAQPLVARAHAHRANAARIAGDLLAADIAFADLKAEITERPHGDVKALGEVASLEASLRIDQRRFNEATELLSWAQGAFEYVGDSESVVRTRIKHAHLLQSQGRPEEVLRLLEEDARSPLPPYLSICAITACVNALCDLDRPQEGRQLLRANLDPFEADGTPHLTAALRGLEGRLSLGLGEYQTAEDYFRTAAEQLAATGRTYDAIMACLYLAEALLAQQRTSELRALSSWLVTEFRGRGIVAEPLEALRLLIRSIADESVTIQLLAEIRQKVARYAQPTPRMRHLTVDDYLAALLGKVPFGLLTQQAHRHLLEVCATCRDYWSGGAVLGADVFEATEPAAMPSDPRTFSSLDLERAVHLLQLSRLARRRGREDLNRLLKLPADKWRRRVDGAHTRLRSRAFAEQLIEESGKRVHISTSEAIQLADLVRPALDRSPDRLSLPWARVLLARAEAHRANALRVEGDLRTADSLFDALRSEFGADLLNDPIARAEVDSLEASLHIEQHSGRDSPR